MVFVFATKQNLDKKSPMEYINEVPPIVCEERIVACIGSMYSHSLQPSPFLLQKWIIKLSVLCLLFAGDNPALGHPVEYIFLKPDEPSVCKYCGLRYILSADGGHGGH